MRGKKFTPEQIIQKLREGEGLIASGMSIDQATKQLSIGLSTWYRWKVGYQNMSTKSTADPCLSVEVFD